MPVPFQPLRRDAAVVAHGVNQFRNGNGQRRAGIRGAVPHRVAEPDFDGNLGFLGKLHQGLHKGDDEAKDVGAG